MSAEDTIKTTIEELLKVLATKNVVGDPIEMEDKILIPITRIGMGFGAGMGESKGQEGRGGTGGGAGGAAGTNAVAVVVIFKGVPGPDGIKVLPLQTPSPIAKTIADIASTMMQKVGEQKDTKKEGEKKEQTKPAKE